MGRHRALSAVYRVTAGSLLPRLAWWSLLVLASGLGTVVLVGRGAAATGQVPGLCPGLAPDRLVLETWLSMELFSWLPLLVSLYGITTICRLVAGPVDDGSMEMMMAGPVPPGAMLWGRLLPVAGALAVLHLSAAVGTAGGFLILGGAVPLGLHLAAMLHSLLLSAVLTAGGLLLSVMIGRLAAAQAAGLGIALLSFTYDLVLRTAGAPDAWRMVTPFGYYTGCRMLLGVGPATFNLIYLAGWLALLLAASLHVFSHTDLASGG